MVNTEDKMSIDDQVNELTLIDLKYAEKILQKAGYVPSQMAHGNKTTIVAALIQAMAINRQTLVMQNKGETNG